VRPAKIDYQLFCGIIVLFSRFDQASLYEQVDLRDRNFHWTTVGRRFGKFFALLRVYDTLIQRVQGLDDIPFDEDAIKFRLAVGKSGQRQSCDGAQKVFHEPYLPNMSKLSCEVSPKRVQRLWHILRGCWEACRKAVIRAFLQRRVKRVVKHIYEGCRTGARRFTKRGWSRR